MKIIGYIISAALTVATIQADAGISYNGESIAAMLTSPEYISKCEARFGHGIVIQKIENMNENGVGSVIENGKITEKFKVSMGSAIYCEVSIADGAVSVDKVQAYDNQ